jgi:tetratricopeptide (TPR) repeat protein
MIAVAFLCGGILAGMPSLDDAKPAEDPKPAIFDMAAYEEASARAGRDAEAHVRLALWCEARGLTSERIKHLARAVLSDPGNVTARSLMGLVSFEGKWVRPEKVAEKLKADPARAAAIDDYLQRRAKTPDTAEAQYKLAIWCEENGLSEQSVAHLRRVVQLDPKRENAWKQLGYKKQPNGRWATLAQLAREKTEIEAQKQADRLWRPKLEKLRSDLESKKAKTREAAALAIEEVTDPRAVPLVWSMFAKGNEARQLVAVQILGQIDAHGSTESLALLSVSSGSAEVRRKSVEILRRRDPRDYGSLLAGLMRKEIKYSYTPVRGPGQTGMLVVEGEKYNTARRYTPPPLPDFSRLVGLAGIGGLVWTTDANGLPALLKLHPEEGVQGGITGYVAPDGSYALAANNRGRINPGLVNTQQNAAAQALAAQMAHNPSHAAQILAENQARVSRPTVYNLGLNGTGVGLPPGPRPGLGTEFDVGRAVVEAERAAVAAEQQLENDVRSLELYNKATRDQNRKIVDVINSASDQNLAPDTETCQRWAVDQLGMAYRATPEESKPTIPEDVPLDYEPPPLVRARVLPAGVGAVPTQHSCFGQGTKVHTQSGLADVATIRAGDLVLSQDLKTGALAFQPVVTVYHNPPNATLKISFNDDESIVATGIHRFWKAGQGWVMARELKAGDAIRTIGGTAEVVSVKDDVTQPVFNLEVASGQTFFVGEAGMLVHDNSLVSPEPKLFDASTDLAALKGKE